MNTGMRGLAADCKVKRHRYRSREVTGIPHTLTEKADLGVAALGLCGILSPLFLIATTLLGGAANGDYDPVRDSISELYEAGAPNAGWLMVLFTTYHALVIPFAVGLHLGLPGAGSGRSGPVLLGLAGIIGIPLGSYARCDPGCFGATTFRGQLHGVLVAASVLLIFAAMFALWRRLAPYAEWRGYARYTLASLVAAAAFGIAMTPFVQGPHTGLLERIAVLLIVQWYAVSGVTLIVAARR